MDRPTLYQPGQSTREDKPGQHDEQIYSKCTMCNIWLGDLGHVDRSSADDAFNLLSFLAEEMDKQRPQWLADQGRRDKAMDLINHIVSLPWWYRIWTVQEAMLPRNATVHWGPCQISWAIMTQAALNWVHPAYNISWDFDTYDLNPFTGFVVGMDISHCEDPFRVLTRWRYRKATNPLDKIYALLGFRDDWARQLPSVGSCDYALAPRTLFTRVSADIIHLYGTLEPLIGKRGETPATEGLPSWATDYAGARPGTPDLYDFWSHGYLWDHHRYNAGVGIEGPVPAVEENYRVLRLTGIRVDIINIVQKKPVSEKYRNWSVRNHRTDIEIRTMTDTIRRGFQKWIRRDITPNIRPVITWCMSEGRFLEELNKLLSGELIPGTSHGQESQLLHLWCHEILPNQAVFITRSGLLGLGPLTTKPGQEVWVLAHSKFPFILAPLAQEAGAGESSGANNDKYSMVGNCFVRGIMMGEALQRSGTSKQRDIRVL